MVKIAKLTDFKIWRRRTEAPTRVLTGCTVYEVVNVELRLSEHLPEKGLCKVVVEVQRADGRFVPLGSGSRELGKGWVIASVWLYNVHLPYLGLRKGTTVTFRVTAELYVGGRLSDRKVFLVKYGVYEPSPSETVPPTRPVAAIAWDKVLLVIGAIAATVAAALVLTRR